MKQHQSEHPFAFFHQNEALLYQFFFHECIAANLAVQKESEAESLHQLMGCSSNQFYSLQGSLPKMLHYYELQITHFDPRPIMDSVGETLDRAYLAGQVCIECIDSDPPAHKKSFQQLRREIKKIGKLLFDHASHYKDNSHVLYFILCHHSQLDTLCGTCVAKFFATHFEGGLDVVEAYLSEKFTQRGFQHLIPNIRKQLDSLNHA